MSAGHPTHAAPPPLPPRRRVPPVAGKRHASYWPLAIAAVIVATILAVAVPVWYLVFRASSGIDTLSAMPATAMRQIADAIQPKTTVSTVITTAVERLHTEAKLVVLTTQIRAEVNKDSGTEWGYVNWGTTTVRLIAEGNRIQYFVPLQDVKNGDVSYEPAARKMTVNLPRPKLDEAMVDVQTDPEHLQVETSNGWAKLDRFSGEPLREEAKHDLRYAVLHAGRSELLENWAEKQGKESIKKILDPMAHALDPNATVDVEFH